ncbi:MAG: hypothetical protein JKY37_01810 [Nannocystaceae bacterium]|nr:hypothetical protein [Nannocystaceae bacterium]
MGGLLSCAVGLAACNSDDVGLGADSTGTGTNGSTADVSRDDGVDDSPDPDDASDPDDGRTLDGGTGECGGCVDGSGSCLPGDADEACGALGGGCTVCEGARVCAEGECLAPPACDADGCDGCCLGDMCVESPNDDACGAGGLQCTQCPSGSVCDEGACALPCETTCDGCCADSGKCIGAEEQSADGCGLGASLCVLCDVGLDCVGGVCISATCANTCAGCCDGDACLAGDADLQCGIDGGGCIECGAGTTCEPEGCVADPMALWDLTLLDGEVNPADPMGDAWDLFQGLPDPYVTINIIGAPVESEFVDNTVFPVWDEVVAQDVTTVQLTAELTFTVWDSDFGLDSAMAACTASIPAEALGSFYELDCVVDGFEAWSLSFAITPSP